MALRLISTGTVKADGTTMVGIEIMMPPTNKTYWRVPGETGFPTELDFAGSTGVMAHRILWPYPTRQDTADYLDYVYMGPTILPVELTVEPGQPRLELEALLGICSDICVPAQARFSLTLTDAAPDRANGLRIKQAAALAPIAWDGAEPPITEVAVRPSDNMLAVSVAEPSVDPMSLIVATEAGEPLFGTPQKSREPNLVLVPILGEGDQIRLEGSKVQLTFLTDEGAFEVIRPVSGGQQTKANGE